MQGRHWMDCPFLGKYQRHSEVFLVLCYGGREMERWEREQSSWRPRRGDGSPTCCCCLATVNTPLELMSHTSCGPVSLFLSLFLSGLSHTPPLSHFSLSLNLFLSIFFPPVCLLTAPPTLCVNIKQKSHGIAILIRLEGASLFLRATHL